MNHKQLLDEFYNTAPWLNLEANDQFLLAGSTKPVTISSLTESASRQRGKLPYRPDYVEAWKDFVAAYPQYNSEGNRDVAFRLLRGDEPTPEAFEEIARSDEGKKALHFTAAAQAASDAAYERQRMIEEIRAGRSTFSMRSKYGTNKVYDCATFEEVQYGNGGQVKPTKENWLATATNEQIAAVHQQVMAERKAKASTVGELRQQVNPARGKPMPDEVFIARVAEQSPQPQPVDDGYVLVDRDGTPFTKKSLIRFINADKENARWLLVDKSTQRINKRAEKELIRILKSPSVQQS